MFEVKYKKYTEIESFCERKIDETERFQFYKSNGVLYYQDEFFNSHKISISKALEIIKTNVFCILPPCESLGGIIEIFPFKGIAIEREVQDFDSFVNDAIEIMNKGDFEIKKSPIERVNEVKKLKIPANKEELECLLESGFYYYYA